MGLPRHIAASSCGIYSTPQKHLFFQSVGLRSAGFFTTRQPMSIFFEIAYAAVNKGLCIFTGTGFSKAVSKNTAPTWQGLLEELCDECANPNKLKESLFPEDDKHPLSLEEAAQVIEIELLKVGKHIHQEIAAIIGKVGLDGERGAIEQFFKEQSFQVVTTNYDKLVEQLVGEADCQSLTPGLPVPRSEARVKVYHVHGSIDVSENMVVTADDYFKFLNAESYFSRKLSTILHENTVVILGYSLGDTNLKAILSDYKGFARNHVIGSNIILVSRSGVDQPLKDYYIKCYGIRVVDNYEVNEFFEVLNRQLPVAADRRESTAANIREVVSGRKAFTDEYLKIERSFYEIVGSISAAGYSMKNTGVVNMLGDIIDKKTALTIEAGAWNQYNDLAKWLIYLGTILEIEGISVEATYLSAVKRSMEKMSKNKALGYSWQAYASWSDKWESITPSNRNLIKAYILKNSSDPDALRVVNL